MPQEISETYIRGRFGKDLPQKNVDVLRTAMQKYDTRWWESKDSVEIARYQIFENVLMTDFSTFLEGFEKLVGRPVYIHEFGCRSYELEEEAREAIARMESKGKPLDDLDEIDKIIAIEREYRSIKALRDYVEINGKSVIRSVIPKNSE